MNATYVGIVLKKIDEKVFALGSILFLVVGGLFLFDLSSIEPLFTQFFVVIVFVRKKSAAGDVTHKKAKRSVLEESHFFELPGGNPVWQDRGMSKVVEQEGIPMRPTYIQ